MHESLFADQAHLDDPHLWERAAALGLDLERFDADRRGEAVRERVQRDFRSGVRAGVVTDAGGLHRGGHVRPGGDRSRSIRVGL